jgi:Zn-dependent protease/predicted transcriptional regulator
MGRVLGIDVHVHVTFLLLLAWVVVVHYFLRYDWHDALEEMVFILVVFGIVLLHELGHALAARRFGIATRDITLLPIGGVARLERMPEEPRQELVVALAGPLVNVVLALGLFAGLATTARFPAFLGDFSAVSAPFVERLFWVNVWLVLFNLLPAFPMDGGRVLRALLAMRLDYVQATQIAATVGQGMALLFGFMGLFLSPLLIFIALFVWIGAAQESSMVQMRTALEGIPVSRAMVRDYRVLSPEDSLKVATGHVLSGFQQDFPVLEGCRLVGVLTRSNLLTALAKHGEETPVAEVMQRDFDTADPTEMLSSVVARLQEHECHSLPVLKGEQVIGLVTLENVGEFVLIQSALRVSQVNGRENNPWPFNRQSM